MEEFKNIKQIDDVGRILIPIHIRKDMNINPGTEMNVRKLSGTSIIIEIANDRCSLCGEGDENMIHLTIGPYKRCLCRNCAAQIKKEAK